MDKEGAILAEMLKIVEQEDWLSSMLEEDRQRWADFLRLIDLAQSRLAYDDDVFTIDEQPGGVVPDMPSWDDIESAYLKCQSYLGRKMSSASLLVGPLNDPLSITEDPSPPEELGSEEEFEHLFADGEDSDSPLCTDSVDELFKLELEEHSPLLQHESTLLEPPPEEFQTWSPSPVIVDGSKINVKELLSPEDLALARKGPKETESEPEIRSFEYFYEKRKEAKEKARKVSNLIQPKIQVFDELDRGIHRESDDSNKDWGSLGVKFENRGAVKDLVWMWEYNHMQQSGRSGAPPELEWRPKRRATLQLPPYRTPELSSSGVDDEPAKKKTKLKKKKGEQCDSVAADGGGGRSVWQTGLLLSVVIFSFFVLYSLFSDYLPFF